MITPQKVISVVPGASSLQNPAAISKELYERASRMPGWAEFVQQVSSLAQYASTPGWEDSDAKKTVIGAKPIGLAQWGSAMMTAALVAEFEPKAPAALPGVDPGGFIWLTWRFADNAELALELRAGLLGQTYAWTSLRDGMPARHTSSSLMDVVEALRSVMIGAGKA